MMRLGDGWDGWDSDDDDFFSRPPNEEQAQWWVEHVARGLSTATAKDAANIIGFWLTADGWDTFLDRFCNQYAVKIVTGILRILEHETDLEYLDEYIYLLTGLRQRLEDKSPIKRMCNMLILEHTEGLLQPFEIGFESAPHGYTAPELVSMWSSILSEEGVAICSKYMANIETALTDCMHSHTVGSIVSILLISNLNGHKPETIRNIAPLFPQVQQAFLAAFSGDIFAERQWGPGPVTKCLATLSTSTTVQAAIIENDLLPNLELILTRTKGEWPVGGFDTKYYMDARVSACKVIANVAKSYDVATICPSLEANLVDLLSSNNYDPISSRAVSQSAYAALLQIVKFKTSTNADLKTMQLFLKSKTSPGHLNTTTN